MVTLWSRRRPRRQSRKACRLRCHTLQLPRSFLAARFALRLCAFLSHRHGENCRAGEAGKGVWGKTWNRAAWGARGVPRFPPVRFRIGPPSCWSRSRAVVFPTSPSGPLGVGVRSGTRRRRGASALAQAAGRIGPGTRRAASARAGAGLCGQCAGCVQGIGPNRTSLLYAQADTADHKKTGFRRPALIAGKSGRNVSKSTDSWHALLLQ
jgi:hypothetical protein